MTIKTNTIWILEHSFIFFLFFFLPYFYFAEEIDEQIA